MKKRLLSESELNQVVRLAQVGTSWLSIESKARVPRRVAKRAYQDWERSKSIEELKASRQQVAADLFRQHIEDLVDLGTSLAMRLEIPEILPTESPGSNEILDGLLSGDIRGVDRAASFAVTLNRARLLRSTSRQNRMLFGALQVHTREDVRWDVLKQWQKTWDSTRDFYAQLQKSATEIVQNFFKQEPGLEEKTRNGYLNSPSGNAVAQTANALLSIIWARLIKGVQMDQGDVFSAVKAEDTFLVKTKGVANSNFLRLRDQSVTEKATQLGNNAFKTLVLGENKDLIEKTLRGNVDSMKRAIEELADMLNPLVLRPLILRTRCDLCPA